MRLVLNLDDKSFLLASLACIHHFLITHLLHRHWEKLQWLKTKTQEGASWWLTLLCVPPMYWGFLSDCLKETQAWFYAAGQSSVQLDKLLALCRRALPPSASFCLINVMHTVVLNSLSCGNKLATSEFCCLVFVIWRLVVSAYVCLVKVTALHSYTTLNLC